VNTKVMPVTDWSNAESIRAEGSLLSLQRAFTNSI